MSHLTRENNMNIKKIKEEIKSLEIYISKNTSKDLQGEELNKFEESEAWLLQLKNFLKD